MSYKENCQACDKSLPFYSLYNMEIPEYDYTNNTIKLRLCNDCYKKVVLQMLNEYQQIKTI